MKKSGRSLEQLAQDINRLHGEVQAIGTQIEELEETKQEKAKRVGRALIEAKERLQHGEWLPWLKENCPDINERTARQYMSFYRGDAETLMSGGVRENGASSDSPPDDELEEFEKEAIDLVKQGKSYRQIGQALGKHHRTIAENPAIRAARMEQEVETHSTDSGISAYCEIESPNKFLKHLDLDIRRILSKTYILNKKDQMRLRKMLEEGIKALDQKYGSHDG